MRNILRLLIIGIMLMSILAACGGPDTVASPSPADEASPSATLPEASPSPEEEAASPLSEASPEAEASPATEETQETDGEAAAGPVELPEVDPANYNGDIVTSGSSTVFPLTQVMAERFNNEGFGGTISVDEIGTGAGFQRFCEAGESDIANASRPIKDEEVQNCQNIGREPIEFYVGIDALAVTVSAQNDFIDEISIEDLRRIFTGEITQWSELDPSYPAEPIQIFSPGTDSGTYDYFVEEVLEDDEANITAFQQLNPTQSENDNVLVQGVEASPYAIGYFGYAYYQENEGRLKILSIDGVEPTEETAESGEYPLSRPLFIYTTEQIMTEKPQVAAFVNFYLSYVEDEILDVGYFPVSENALNEGKQKWLDAVGDQF